MENLATTPKNITESTLIHTGPGILSGMYVNSTTGGTIKFINGLTAYNEEADASTGSLTFTGVVADGETVTIGTETYEFDTDSEVTAGNIAVDVSGGVTAGDAVTALVTAITAESALVTAIDDTGDVVTVTTVATGLASKYASTTTCENASWGAVTLTGGADANTYLNNTITPAVGYHSLGNGSFTTGLYATIANTLNVTLYYKPL